MNPSFPLGTFSPSGFPPASLIFYQRSNSMMMVRMLELVFPDLAFCTSPMFIVTPYPLRSRASQNSRSGAGTRVITCIISPASPELPLIGLPCAIQHQCFSWRDREPMLNGLVIQLGHLWAISACRLQGHCSVAPTREYGEPADNGTC